MAKYINDLAMDAELDYIADSDKLCICSAQPTTYAEATSTYMLAVHDLTGGDFSKANGDASGRKLTLAAQNGFSVTNTGTATHYALCKSTGSVLKLVGTVTSQALTAGNTVNFPQTDVDEIGDPT